MKFSKIGQVFLVSSLALILASTFTACNPVTIDYVFAAGSSQSMIQTFQVDRVSGALSGVGKLISSGGVTPVSEAVSTDYSHLYVANQGDSSLVEFNISGSGALSSVATVTESAEGNTPVAISMNAAGTLLYVANRFQPGCTTATTGAATCNGGALAVFPVASGGALGTAVANGALSYWPIGINPTAVNSLANGAAVYASTYDPAAGIGYLYGYASSSGGTLTSIVASNRFDAGVRPVSIATDPLNRFVYVVDFAQNELIAFSVEDGSVLHPLINGPFRTGNQPSSIQIDPRGKYLYVTNQLDNTVSAYAIDLATGTPSAALGTSGASANSTGTEPVAILVDPSFGRYVYSANLIDNSLSGFQLNSSTGVLSPAQSGPFPTVQGPTALAAVPHGNHSIQNVTP